jgi:outer membrane biosynthesis protein TonB
MEYSKIIAITGLPGLYELINSKSDGGIVRSLEDKSTRFVSSRVHQFSHLESIEVYTERHNENLVTILKAMEESKEKLPDDKDPAALKSYFEKVYPGLDHSRVYTSDLKKMVKWFSVLQDNKIEIKLSEPVVEEGEAEQIETKTAEAKPVKKVPAPKEKEKEKEEEKKPAAKKAVKKESPSKEAAAKSEKKKPAKKAAAAKNKDEKKSSAGAKSKKPAAKKKSK